MAKSSKLIAAKRGTVLLVRRKEDQLWKEVKNRNRGYADRRHLIAFDFAFGGLPSSAACGANYSLLWHKGREAGRTRRSDVPCGRLIFVTERPIEPQFFLDLM